MEIIFGLAIVAILIYLSILAPIMAIERAEVVNENIIIYQFWRENRFIPLKEIKNVRKATILEEFSERHYFFFFKVAIIYLDNSKEFIYPYNYKNFLKSYTEIKNEK